MKLFGINPTIREANRYLSETVDDLSKKHGGVSNEDFERDLVAATGIGWKQVKNYKNHPKPRERLKDNAVVLRFVLQARARDTGRKVRRIATMAVSVLAFAYVVFWYAMTPKKTEQFVIHEVPPNAYSSEVVETRVFLTLPSKSWMFRLGPLEHSSVPVDKFTCMDNQGGGTKSCAFRDPDIQATLVLDGNMVRRYTIVAFRSEDIAELKDRLVDLLGERVSRFPASTKPLDELSIAAGKESVHLMATAAGHDMRPMLSITVSLQ